MNRLGIVLFICAFCFVKSINAQDVPFMMQHRVRHYLNPALTNSRSKHEFDFISQNLHRQTNSTFVSFQTRLNPINSGFGIYYRNENNFAMSRNSLGLSISHQFRFSRKSILLIGLAGEITNNNFKLPTIPIISPYPTNGLVIKRFDYKINVGLVWFMKNFLLGVSAKKYTTVNPILINIMSGYTFRTKTKDWKLTPIVNITIHDLYYGYNLRLITDYKKLRFSLGTSGISEFITSIGLNYDKFSLEYGYGFQNTLLSSLPNHTHELAFHFKIPYRKFVFRPNPYMMPDF